MGYRLESRPIGFGFDPLTSQSNQGIVGSFVIPDYQRGYRWSRDEVRKLLDDLAESSREGKQRYSLQPIVVRKWPGDKWELIDGQQRLTTLWLIFNFMAKAGYKRNGAAYTLEYHTRPSIQTYLQTLDQAQSTTNIDHFHLYNAHEAIGQWIEDQGATAQAREASADQIHAYLSNSVRVIWYEIPEDEEPIPLFTRLNQGRIPLTDAELIKAVLLMQIQQAARDREIEVAAQWDGIERDLQRPEIWAFAAPWDDGVQQLGTRIDLLLDTLADKPATGARRYHTFDALHEEVRRDGQAFWKKVVELHAQILGWFEEPRWHNKIGFLVSCGLSLGEILRMAQGQSKKNFDHALTTRIRATLKTSVGELDENLKYEGSGRKLQRLLLMFNVEICRERFPFKEHSGARWSLEHIHAQNAQDLNRAEQWETWLREHRQALCDIQAGSNTENFENLLANIDEAIPRLHTRQFGQEQFKSLAEPILLALNGGVVTEVDHTIANLALLSHGANAALSNAVFEVKRHKVLEMDKLGDYIPAATRNVFLKYYTPADRIQPHFWSEADKDAYLQTLKTVLAPYLQ